MADSAVNQLAAGICSLLQEAITHLTPDADAPVSPDSVGLAAENLLQAHHGVGVLRAWALRASAKVRPGSPMEDLDDEI